MPLRLLIGISVALSPGIASAFDPAQAPRSPSPDPYRPNVDQLTAYGPLKCAPGSVCDASGLSVGGSALGSGIIKSVLTHLTPAQVADARSGAATIDLAPTINRVLNSCMPGLPAPTIEFPPGRYGVKDELLASTCPVNVVLDAGATIVQTGGFAAGVQMRGIIHFKGAASGSTLTGSGTIDGNRAALVSSYLALPKSQQSNGLYVMSSEWDCVVAEAIDDVRIEGITVRNCMSFGVSYAAGRRGRVNNVKILDTSAATNFQVIDGAVIGNITETNIGNVVNGIAIPWFSYANIFSDLKSSHIYNVALNGYTLLARDGTSAAPGQRIGDPYGGAFMGIRLNGSTVRGLAASGNDYSDGRATPAGWGFSCENCINVSASDITVKGFYWGASIKGARRFSLNGAVLDGQYNTASVSGASSATALWVQPSGQLRENPGLSSAFDHYNAEPSADVSIGNVVATRSNIGFTAYSGGFSASNLRAVGNEDAGIQLWANARSNSYPGGARFPVRDIQMTGIISAYNGGAGILIADGVDVRWSGLDVRNNGQNSAVTNHAEGITATAGFGGDKKRIFFNGWSSVDDQAEPISGKLSFIPGSSVGNSFELIASNSAQLHIGQKIKVIGAGSPGDNTVRISDLTDDRVTVRTGGAMTFNDVACRVSLAGTVTMSAGTNLLTGSATSFKSAIPGPTYILAGGQYLKIGAVIDDTHLQMDTQAGVAFSRVKAQLVQCDARGIPSQSIGVSVAADPNIADISLGSPSSYRAVGNVNLQISVAPASQYNDLSSYAPTFSAVRGSGVTLAGGAKYKLDGKILFIFGYVQVKYNGTAPYGVQFTLPDGLTTAGGMTLSAYNADLNMPAFSFGNNSRSMTVVPVGGSTIVTESGQYVQFNGSIQVQ